MSLQRVQDARRRAAGVSGHRRRSTGHSVARELTFANVLGTTGGVNQQNFYGSREPDGGSCWMPGETLEQGSSRFERVPFDCDSSPSDQPSNSAILDAIKGIQDGVDMKMSAIGDKLDTVSDRLKELESRQKVLEDDFRASSSSAAPSPRMPVPGKRVRRTPPALQVLDTFLYLLTNTFLFTEQNSTDSFIF